MALATPAASAHEDEHDKDEVHDLPRFTAAQWALHWSVATLVLACALTGLTLYIGPLSAWVGRRNLVKDVHVYAGLALPLPFVVAYAGRWRTAIRRDLRRLSRWTRADRLWLRSRGREATGEVGKFNAGQKLNAAFVGGMIPVMLATGVIMRWFEPFPLSWRTGATFVHDWTAIATWLVVAGHILFAFSQPQSLRGMLTGRVARWWAEDLHPRWAEEARAKSPPQPPTMAALSQEERQQWTSASGSRTRPKSSR
jgi:formate dehydrogenase subunit gamma